MSVFYFKLCSQALHMGFTSTSRLATSFYINHIDTRVPFTINQCLVILIISPKHANKYEVSIYDRHRKIKFNLSPKIK